VVLKVREVNLDIFHMDKNQTILTLSIINITILKEVTSPLMEEFPQLFTPINRLLEVSSENSEEP